MIEKMCRNTLIGECLVKIHHKRAQRSAPRILPWNIKQFSIDPRNNWEILVGSGHPNIPPVLVIMLSSKAKTCFFLSYLVLLLNFGPSLHHAPIFGLHGHHHHAKADLGIKSTCCCQSHSHETQPKSSNSVDPTVDPLGSFGVDESGCAFCKFFDEYNVVIASFECTHVESPISLFVSELPDGATAEVVPRTARGPPVA